MRKASGFLSAAIVLLVQLCACGDSGGNSASSEDQADSGSGLPQEPDGSVDAGGEAPTVGDDTLAFQLDGTPIDFAGANNASYYREDLGKWRLVIVLNDVLGDKYISLDITSTDSSMLEEQSYDCSKQIDDVAMGRAKITFRDGEQTWSQAEGKPCNITISSIGDVGGRLTGSFSATLASKDEGGSDIVLSDGSFDVERQDI